MLKKNEKMINFFFYSEHPLSALSQGNVSVISSFNQVMGDAYSDCNNGDRQK